MRELRDYQVEALHKLKVSLSTGHKRPILTLSTGGGKTAVAAAIVRGALAKGNRVIFTVPALSLIDQTVAALMSDGVTDIGVLQGDHPETDWSRPCQVASVMTLTRREAFLERWRKEAGRVVVIIDEAHWMSQFYPKWFKAWHDVPFIGLTATPYSKGLGKLFDDLIVAETTRGLIERGYLAPFKVFAPAHPDLTGVKMLAGDYQEKQLGEAMNKTHLVADVVMTWLEKGEKRPTICFGVTRAHAQNIKDSFLDAHVRAEYMDANTPLAERMAIRGRSKSGETEVVVNVGVMTLGVDWPWLSCLILARPTKSSILYSQIVGRVLRAFPGKEFTLILDHSDTTLNLGFVTDILPESLDDGKHQVAGDREERKPPLPKECPACSFLKPAGMRKCEACGFETKPQARVHTIDGELVELDVAKKPKPSGQKQFSMVEKMDFYAELMGVVQIKGYKSGWAANQYKNRFGVWPRGMEEVRALPPSPHTLAWISKEQRKWRQQQRRTA